MQIVVDIPDGCYDLLIGGIFPVQDAYRLLAWIKNGTPLPNKHGRLIDADKVILNATIAMKNSNHEYMECVIAHMECVIAHMKLAPTIIKAESEDKE